VDDARERVFQRRVGLPRERALDRVEHLTRVALVQRGDERVLVREVLVERTHAHAGQLGHRVGGGGRVAAFDQNASRGVEDGPNRGLGTRLARQLSRGKRGVHGRAFGGVTNASRQCE